MSSLVWELKRSRTLILGKQWAPGRWWWWKVAVLVTGGQCIIVVGSQCCECRGQAGLAQCLPRSKCSVPAAHPDHHV